MEKWQLENKICELQSRIFQNNALIRELQDKISQLRLQKNQLSECQELTEIKFAEKRRKAETNIDFVLGRAGKSAISKDMDLFCVENCNSQITHLENIKYVTDENIRRMQEKMNDLQTDNASFDSSISSCRRKIAEIERKEREYARINNK